MEAIELLNAPTWELAGVTDAAKIDELLDNYPDQREHLTFRGHERVREILARRLTVLVSPSATAVAIAATAPAWPEPHSFAEAAGPDFNTADVTSAPSDCNQRLATIAVIELLPRLISPGDCGGGDMVRLDAVVLPNHRRVGVARCRARHESFAAWVRDEASAHIATLGRRTTRYRDLRFVRVPRP